MFFINHISKCSGSPPPILFYQSLNAGMKFIYYVRNSDEELNVKKINAVIEINATFSAADKKPCLEVPGTVPSGGGGLPI